MANNVQHNGFESKEFVHRRRKYTVRYFERSYNKQRHIQKEENGISMLAKMGVCALLAGMVLLSEFVAKNQSSIIETSAEIPGENMDIGGDYLGKLRFVELPGIMQVFSSDAKLRIGVDFDNWQLNDDKTIITIDGIKDSTVPVSTDGTIKTISHEGEYTAVVLGVDGDLSISYKTDGKPAVEEGQPVKQGDTMFESAEYLEISITKAGRPVEPTDYYDMTGEVFS